MLTRCQSCVRLARSCARVAARAAARAATTMSTGGKACCWSRNDSRTVRRTRLRATALPIVLAAIARPMRAVAGAPAAGVLMVRRNIVSLIRRPPANAASKSRLRSSRCERVSVRGGRKVRESASCGPWRDAAREPCARSGSPCVHESRACACAEFCWADMYVSC